MKRMKKVVVMMIAVVMVLGMSMTAMAAQWQQNGTGWWYQEDNGSWPANTWSWINGKCYYFDANGYMLANATTPDGYQVDASGAWVINGVVQSQTQAVVSNEAQSYTCTIWLMGVGDSFDAEPTDFYTAQLMQDDEFFNFYDSTGTIQYTRANKPEWVGYEENYTECVVTGEIFTAADGFRAIKVSSVIPK